MDNFDKNLKLKTTCRNCGRAIVYEKLGTVVCGTWHATFSINSLCDEFQTPEQVREENRKAGEALRMKRDDENYEPYEDFERDDYEEEIYSQSCKCGAIQQGVRVADCVCPL